MSYIDKLKNVSVLGAAGKMGSGILLLTAMEMVMQSLKPENKGKTFVLNAIDISNEALNGLILYVREQARKTAEKQIVMLRKAYADRVDLIENADIITQFENDVVAVIKPTTRIEATYDSYLICEVVSENPDLKVKLFDQIEANSNYSPWYFTNTSSIPIKELDSKGKLNGRIMGVHFYNPPAVQRLVELIKADNTLPELEAFSQEYVKNLGKIIVPSADVAGFVSNGHYMRDTRFGIEMATRLANEMPLHEAIFAVDTITRDYMVRPMGIFQLDDYVGIDVVQYIMKVMKDRNIDNNLQSELLDRMVDAGVKGGQNSDGSQKDGFFKYEKGKQVAVLNPENMEYVDVSVIKDKVIGYLAAKTENMPRWKDLLVDRSKADKLKLWFDDLKADQSKGAALAIEYMHKSKEIGLGLVNAGVAASKEDVNTVLETGFFHLYGPINEYV
jgi:3-hydroxyacyl-CoA dehydrogenase